MVDLFPSILKKGEEKKWTGISQINPEISMKDDVISVATQVETKTKVNPSKDELQKKVSEDVQQEIMTNQSMNISEKEKSVADEDEKEESSDSLDSDSSNDDEFLSK